MYSHLIYRDYSVDEGALKIDRLRPEDAGTYICNAQNDMGKYEHSTSLVVGGKALTHVATFYRLLCICANWLVDSVTGTQLFPYHSYNKKIDHGNINNKTFCHSKTDDFVFPFSVLLMKG